MNDKISDESKCNVINNIARALNMDSTIPEYLIAVRQELFKVFDVTNFSVYCFTHESDVLTELIHYANDTKKESNDSIIEISHSQLIKSLIGKKKATLFTDKKLFIPFGIRTHGNQKKFPNSIIGVPFLEDNNLLGFIVLQSFESENTYSKADLDLLSIVATHIGLFTTRKRTENALKKSEENYRALTRGNPDVIFRLDSEGNILDFHASPEDLILPQNNFKNATIKDVLSPEQGIECMSLIQSVIQTGIVQLFHHDIWHKNTQFYFEGRIVKNGENEVLMIVRNITERRKQEEKSNQSFVDLQLIDQINRASLKNATFKELAHEILDIHQKIIPISRGRFYLFEEETTELEFIDEWLENDIIQHLEEKSGVHLEKIIPSLSKESGFFKVLEDKEMLVLKNPVSIRELIKEGEQNILLKKFFDWSANKVNILTFIVIPYVSENKIFGLMTLSSKENLSEVQINRIRLFNNQITAALAKTKVEQEIYNQKKFNEQVLNNIPVDIVVFDKNQNYLYINPEAIKSDETRSWLIGKNDFDYAKFKGISENKALKRNEHFNKALQAKKDIEFVDEHQMEDGTIKYMLRKFHPYFENSTLKLVIGYGVDITKMIQTEKSMEEFTKQLELQVEQRTSDLTLSQEKLEIAFEKEKQLGELKSRFVTTASHQFRTPMSIIQSNSDLLAMITENSDMALRPKLEKAVERIQREIKRMTNLMDDILILGKITAGKVNALFFQPTDLLLFCKELVEEYNEIQTSDRRFEVEHTGRQRKVSIDQKLMNHALSNLISNALKYSTKGNPKIRLEYNKEEVKILIIDQGIGIPPKEMRDLFEPFHRAENVGSISGTGLGLTIVKEYVELNGGKIIVESILNEQTIFTLTFPYGKIIKP